jgi:folate-binding protein YgfZ
MAVTPLVDLHRQLDARFTQIQPDHVVVNHYGDPMAEHRAVASGVGLIDRYYRTKLKVTGPDAVPFLNGQITNDAAKLEVGWGIYSVAVDRKGKVLGDPFVYRFPDSLLVDVEPAATEAMVASWNHHIIADDVRIEDLTGDMNTLSLVGPRGHDVLAAACDGGLPEVAPLQFVGVQIAGEQLVCVRSDFAGVDSYDLFLWTQSLIPVWTRLMKLPKNVRPMPFGDAALTTLMVEAGQPRFGRDLTDRNLPQEAGIEERAISYAKGCYIGQEVICRVHNFGHVTRSLTGLLVGGEGLPAPTEKILADGTEVGWITQAVDSPSLGRPIALGYVKRDWLAPGTQLLARSRKGREWPLEVVALPFSAG